MKFVRHLIAVVLAVAVIVGLGMLWAHACGGGGGSGSALRRAPSREALLRLEQVKAGVIGVHSGTGFHLADTGDLIRSRYVARKYPAIWRQIAVIRNAARAAPSHTKLRITCSDGTLSLVRHHPATLRNRLTVKMGRPIP